MSEPVPVYETTPIICSKCGSHIADSVQVGGLRMVKAHGLVALYLEGACSNCGAVFSFNLGRRGLRNLILKSL